MIYNQAIEVKRGKIKMEMNIDYNLELGKRIRIIRKQSGITMKELGDMVGLHEATVQKYEVGKIKNIELDTIYKFAKALNVDESVLLGWQDKKKEVSKTIANSLDTNTIDNKFMSIYATLTAQQKEALLVIASQLKN